MALATPNTNKPAIQRQTCPACKTRFRTTSAIKVYCTPACQKEATKKKRRVTRVDRALNSAFLYHLAYECERAGTLQILSFHTVESLVALYGVYRLKLKANQYGSTKDFEISHIAPVKGNDTLGLYCAENLVVSPTKLNRDHGTTYYSQGRSIHRSTLQPRHSVEKGASRKSTVQRIIQFLGADVVEEVVRIAKIQPTQRAKVMSWLHTHLDPDDQQHRIWLEGLDDMCTKALSALKAKVEGREEGKFKIDTRTFSALEVLLTELSRHCAHRTELIPVQTAIRSLMEVFFKRWGNLRYHTTQNLVGVLPDDFLSPVQLQALFDVLHGKPVQSFAQVFEVYHNEAVERIPPYRPITFTKPPVLLATIQAHVPSTTPISFADFLDGEGLGVVPVLLPVLAQTGLAPQIEPLPWD